MPRRVQRINYNNKLWNSWIDAMTTSMTWWQRKTLKLTRSRWLLAWISSDCFQSFSPLWQAKCSNNVNILIRLIFYVILYYTFNCAFYIQLTFNIQCVIQYSTFHSTFNYSFWIQFFIYPFNYLFNNFN